VVMSQAVCTVNIMWRIFDYLSFFKGKVFTLLASLGLLAWMYFFPHSFTAATTEWGKHYFAPLTRYLDHPQQRRALNEVTWESLTERWEPDSSGWMSRHDGASTSSLACIEGASRATSALSIAASALM
jgi:hypothetical protein